jgi:tetratricopeptide (TPR) repeat protein
MKSTSEPGFAPLRASRWPVALAAVMIGLGILTAYHNSFRGSLIFDDEPAILENPSIQQLWPVWRTLAPPADLTVTGRPVANFTLAVNYALSGTNVWSYHALNLLIHLLAGLTLFGVVRRTLLQPFLRERFGRDAFPLAVVIALLWSLHPLQTEAVTYVIQRVESLMGLFYLLTFYCFIRSVESPRPRLWQACAVAACLLGAATKEVTATAPLLVLLYDRTFVAGSFREAWRRRGGLHVALAATWLPLAGLVASAGWDRNGTSGFDVGITPWAYWLTQFEAVTRYLWLSVWPHPLVFEYGTFWVNRSTEVALYALVVVVLAGAVLVALWRRPVLGFLGAWFFVILAPTSVMPGRIQMIVEHRMYLPLAAVIALAVGSVAARYGRRSLVVFLALAVGAGWLTVQRNEVYRNGESLWRDTVAKRPANERAYNCLGVVLFKDGQSQEAIQSYETALRLRPEYPEAHNNLGYALTKAGRIPEAIEQCRAALRLKPNYAKAYNNLGNALLEAGRIPEAIQHYETSLRIQPNEAKTHYNLGNALLQAGRIPEAIHHYEASLQIKADDAEAQFNLGNALFQAGRIPEAIHHYETSLQINPGYAEAHGNLGSALLQMERTPEAIAEFQATLRIKPDYAEGYNNLGAALYQAGRINDAIRQFETALRIKPGYLDARQNLERLQKPVPAAGSQR